jgi:hypothetical protein
MQQISPLAQSPASLHVKTEPAHALPEATQLPLVSVARQHSWLGTGQVPAPHVTVPGVHGRPPSGVVQPPSLPRLEPTPVPVPVPELDGEPDPDPEPNVDPDPDADPDPHPDPDRDPEPDPLRLPACPASLAPPSNGISSMSPIAPIH